MVAPLRSVEAPCRRSTLKALDRRIGRSLVVLTILWRWIMGMNIHAAGDATFSYAQLAGADTARCVKLI